MTKNYLKSGLILIAVLLSSLTKAFAQEKQQITFTTQKKAGDEIGLFIDGNDLSIDLGDGKVSPLKFSGDFSVFTLAGQNVKIYGDVTQLECPDAEISAIDLSKNDKLISLDCSKNNIKTLNLSANTSLVAINCNDNKISSLDLSNNKELRTIYCEGNELTSLNLSSLENIEDLRCANNQLSAIDVSRSTNLLLLFCEKNNITSLDISNNTALQTLLCSDNNLSSLDISKNAELIELHLYNNMIKSKEMADIVAALNDINDYKAFVVVSDKEKGNEITKEQVEQARKKYWQVQLITLSDDSGDTQDYEGMDKTAIVDVARSSVSAYYNPTAKALYIDGVKANDEVGLYSVKGNLIYNGKARVEGQYTINMVSFTDGVYILKVGNSSMKIAK